MMKRMPTVVSGAARVVYDARGDGPAVLLLHAGVTDRRSWGPLVDAVGARSRCIAYDRRGFGETTYEPELHSEVGDALAVLDAEGVDTAVLVGASNGGKRAIDLALTHPERVRALVLIGAAVRGAPDEDPALFAEPVQRLYAAYEAAERGDDPDELNRIEAHAWLDGWAADEGRVTGPVRDLFLAMNGIALRAVDPGPDEDLPSAWDRLGAIHVPTLVLCGDLDVVSAHVSDHLAAEIPDARFEQLVGTGHLPHLEGHPGALAAISDFLHRLSGWQ